MNSSTSTEQGSSVVLIPTILCGGVGARLWPVSREMHPKPFMKMDDGESLIQKAFLRGANLDGVSELLTVTNRELYFKIEDEYRQIAREGFSTSFILEPFGRNTAPAIAIACLLMAEKHGPDAQLLILPADHLIANYPSFCEAVNKASELASAGKIVTFGIKPGFPETGYGYIESEGFDVKRFVEKPDLATATEYLAAGNYLWNSGMFCFSVSVMLEELRRYQPEIVSASEHCLVQSRNLHGEGQIQVELDSESFGQVPDDSIDYAVMEKTESAAVIPCDIGWSDIGCWNSMGDLIPADSDNNRVHGDAVVLDSRNCTIRSEHRMVAALGLEDIIVIDTADAVLVASKNSTQDVKKVFTALKNNKDERHRFHNTVYRPWGSYTVLEVGTGFKMKRIEVKPGGKLSLQMHHHRSEHWVVIEGEAEVTNGDSVLQLGANESTFIPATHKHRLENIGDQLLVIIEVQTGAYLGEDDIVRFDDIYGRAVPLA